LVLVVLLHLLEVQVHFLSLVLLEEHLEDLVLVVVALEEVQVVEVVVATPMDPLQAVQEHFLVEMVLTFLVVVAAALLAAAVMPHQHQMQEIVPVFLLALVVLEH
jgi:cytosine/uracil/thiamine/allantoin permease